MNEISPSRPIPLILSLVAGILTVQCVAELPHPGFILALAAFAVALVRRYKFPACFLVGIAWALAYATLALHENLPTELEGQDIRVVGRVLDLPHNREGALRFDFRIEQSPYPDTLPRTVRLNWFRTDALPKAGELWRLTVRLKKPHGYFNPGGLDYEQWLFAQGIRATGYVRDDPGNTRLEPASVRYTLQAWRQGLADRLDQALAWSPLRGIVKALTMGVEDDITPSQWEVLRRTGTAHLVAISGSHIGLVAGWSFVLARALVTRLCIQRWSPSSLAALVAFVAAWFYGALADFAIPTQRALIMIALVMGSVMLRRPLRPWHTLAIALLAVSLYDPLAVIAPGFWLSFGAVGLIVLAVDGRLKPPTLWSGLWRINAVTALGLAPLLLLFFQQVSLISPLANLLAVPVLGLVAIPLCLLGSLLLMLYLPAGLWLLSVVEHLLQPAWRALEWLSTIPFAQWIHPSPPLWTLMFALPGIVLLIAPRGIPGRWLGAVMLLPAVTLTPPRPVAGGLRLTLLDVGQGLAVVAETASRTLVFDTGARLGPNFDLGQAVIEPYLRRQGVGRIDVLVVSHGDNDHIGGTASLLQRFPTGGIYSSVPDRLPRALPCEAGQSWSWDGVRFDMLGPLKKLDKENDNSCVLSVSTAGAKVLLTGDIEQAAESALVEHYGSVLASNVLIAPHHGSKTSSSAAFLEQVRPRDILIPAGYRNRYGFPHPDVMARYRALNANVLNTAKEGAITINFVPGEESAKPQSYRRMHGHYWNARAEDK